MLKQFLENTDVFSSVSFFGDNSRILFEGALKQVFENQKIEEVVYYYYGKDYAKISFDHEKGYVIEINSSLEEVAALWNDCLDYLFSPKNVFWRMANSDCSDEVLLRKKDEVLGESPGLLNYVNNILKNCRPELLKE